jgi:hypothetical protein
MLDIPPFFFSMEKVPAIKGWVIGCDYLKRATTVPTGVCGVIGRDFDRYPVEIP